MNGKCAGIALVKLAPDYNVGIEMAHTYAANLADILNTDEGLPEGMLRPSGLPPETARDVLSFTANWCRANHAEFFVIVLPGDIVAGSIALSHIDPDKREARVGYFLASGCRERGCDAQALSEVFEIARSHGLQRVSSTVLESDVVERSAWHACGVTIESDPRRVTALLTHPERT